MNEGNKISYVTNMPTDINSFIHDLERCRFYGSLEIKLEAGRIVLVRKTETIKPSNYRDNRGEYDGKR